MIRAPYMAANEHLLSLKGKDAGTIPCFQFIWQLFA